MWGLHYYDENLRNNSFFQEILRNHSDLITEASHYNRILCIPRQNTFELHEITTETILDHILIPPNYTTTLSKKSVLIHNKEILSNGKKVKILFEETFYVGRAKYLVFCVEAPLFKNHATYDAHRLICLETLDNCIDFLWRESYGHILGKIQRLCEHFIHHNKRPEENVQNLREIIGSLYSQCLQAALKNKTISDHYYLENLKLAIETYMQNCLQHFLIKSINTLTSFSDAQFNKIVRNCSDLQLKDFSIGVKKVGDLITRAKSELVKINNYNTILDKMQCLKMTFNYLHGDTETILQILIFLILKLNINNWTANFVYLTQFQLSSSHNMNSSEINFIITTLEAALEFIKSGQISSAVAPSANSPLFETITNNDLPQFQQLFNDNSSHNLNEKGQSLLTYASLLSRPAFVDFLITKGALVDHQDYLGRTPLHYACLIGDQSIVFILIHSKANVNLPDNDGNTPLHLAANQGHENCVKALLYSCKDLQLNCVNNNNETALHLAAKWTFLTILKILLENDANTNITNNKNQLAINLCNNHYSEAMLEPFSHKTVEEEPPTKCSFHQSDTVSDCKEHGIGPKGLYQIKKIDLLLKAIENNDFPLTCFYLGFEQYNKKCHPLCNCENCEEDFREEDFTVNRGEGININTCNIDGFTPLHIAAKFGRGDVLSILLERQALPHLKTYKTLQTPLHLACINQHSTVVEQLLQCCKNCDINAQDYKGNTALYYAAIKNDVKIVEILMAHGANSHLKNYQGDLIIKEVQEKNRHTIENLLEDQIVH